jgi:hypothetical protein
MEENQANTPTVRTVGLKFGAVSALVGIVFFLILTLSGQNAFDNKWGWVSMVFSIVILVLAHRNFKSEGDGFMSYSQGVGIGFWMALVGVVVGAIFTYVYSNIIDPATMDTFYENQYEQMQKNGMSDDQIDVAVSWTKKLFWWIYLFFGIFFGLIIALIVTIFTQKKSPEQTF